jgi:hypothetical protein
MFAAGSDPHARIDAALDFARRAGMRLDEDILAAGYAPPAPRAFGKAEPSV